MTLFRLRLFAVLALLSLCVVAVQHGAAASIGYGMCAALALAQLARPLHLLGAAPVQRGTAHATFTAPTSTVFTIDAESFRQTPTGDGQTIKNESAEDVLDVYSNPGYLFEFTGTLKAGQSPLIKGSLITLTFPASWTPTGAIECEVVNEPTAENFGRVIRQTIQAKYNTAKGDISP